MPGAAIVKNPRELLQVIKETYADWSEDKASRLAAALAYYTAFSIAPLLLLSISIAGLLFGQEAAQGQVFGQLQGLLGPEAAATIETAIANSQDSSTSTISAIIGILTLLWSASNVFAQLQEALNTIWEVAPDPNAGIMATIKRRFFSMTMVLGIGFLLLVSLVVSAGTAAVSGLLGNILPGGAFLAQVLSFVLSFAVITALFAAIYKVLPDATIEWGDVWVGAVVTALLFAIGKLVIGLYLGHASIGSTFGAAGSLLVFLVWVYYSAQILFFGAEFTQVYARRYGSRIVPAEGAVALTEEARANEGIPRTEAVEQAAAQKASGQQPAAVATLAAQTNGKHGTSNGTPARTNGATAQANGTPAQTKGAAALANGSGPASGNGQRTATKRKPRGNGGTKGAPDAVKKVMWAGLVAGSMALGTMAAHRASSAIWRGILHEDPPTKDF